MKKIAILGSTGSIGTQTVDILPSIEAEVVALTTNRRIGLLEEQARALHQVGGHAGALLQRAVRPSFLGLPFLRD